jgi:hypothetical protein
VDKVLVSNGQNGGKKRCPFYPQIIDRIPPQHALTVMDLKQRNHLINIIK